MKLTTITAAVLLASPVLAQVGITVGPELAPLGSPIAVTLSNDSGGPAWHGICPFRVESMTNDVVYSPLCPAIAAYLGDGEVFTAWWPQTDNSGLQVAPGTYNLIASTLEGDEVSFPIQVGGAKASLAILGTPAVGSSRHLYLTAPTDPGMSYVAAASFGTTPGMQTCAGVLPLNPDNLWTLSLSGSKHFTGISGVLDGNGISTMPVLNIPNRPSLVGLEFHMAYHTLNGVNSGCTLGSVSAPLDLMIQ